jgi:hypothetical protein
VYSAAVNGGSGYFDGSGDSLQIPNNTFNVSSSDITIELWAYFLSISSTHIILELGSGASGDLQFYAEGNVVKFGSSGTAKTGVAIAINQWHHLAAVKTGNTYYLYVDGIRNTSQSSGSASASTVINIGSRNNSSLYTFGYISNFRISNFARYTTSTIAVPTSPVSADANTVVLLNFTNAAITDATAKNVLETVGNAQISTAQSKWTGGSMSFDGSGDYLAFQNGPNLNFSFDTADFTIEGWIYLNTSTTQTLLDIYDANSSGRILLQINTSRQLQWLGQSGVTRTQTSSSIALSTWTHFSVCRTSGSTRIFIGGTQGNTTYPDINNYTCTTGKVLVGINAYDSASSPLNGYISDLRITKGVARYTANFTPPGAQFIVR